MFSDFEKWNFGSTEQIHADTNDDLHDGHVGRTQCRVRLHLWLTLGSRPIPVYTRPRIYHCAEGSTWYPTHVQRQHATWNSKLRTSRWNFTASGIRLGGGKPDSWPARIRAVVRSREKKNRLSDAVNRTREIYTICEHVISRLTIERS